MKKVISIITAILIISMMSVTFAVGAAGIEVSPSIIDGAATGVNKVLNTIQWIGYAFAIGMLIYVGIKYMMSAANERANLKSGLINWIIGAIIVAAVATICGWVSSFANNLGGGGGGDGSGGTTSAVIEVLPDRLYI